MRWGPDDRRPQQLLDLIKNSGTATVCIATKAKFIEGNGFLDQTFYKAVINERGETMDQLLTRCATDEARFVGFALLVNINLLGNPFSVYHIPVEHFRLGLPDADGTIDYGFVKHPKPPGTKGREQKPTRHLVFDPLEPAADRAARVASWEGGPQAYPGEVFYTFAAAAGYYPEPVYESVELDMDTEPRLKKSRRNDTAAGYSAKVIITEIGNANPDQTKLDADAEKYGNFVGEDGAQIMVNYAESETTKVKVETIEAPDASDRYETDEAAIRANIRGVFQIPTVLYGEAVAGKLGTTQEMEDATKYVQNIVVNTDQRAIERGFTDVFRTFQHPGGAQPFLHLKDFSIQNLSLLPQTHPTLEVLTSLPVLMGNKLLDVVPWDVVLQMLKLPADTPKPANLVAPAADANAAA